MSVNSKMTAIADEIRTLSGTTGTMGLDAMASNVSTANDEVNSQTDLIAQITTALEGKAGGSGSGDASVETCTVNISCFNEITALAYTTYENGEIVANGDNSFYQKSCTLNNVVCGSAIFVTNVYNMNGASVSGGANIVAYINTAGGVFRAPLTAGAIGSIDIYDND